MGQISDIKNIMVLLARHKIYSHIGEYFALATHHIVVHLFVTFSMLAYRPIHPMWIC